MAINNMQYFTFRTTDAAYSLTYFLLNLRYIYIYSPSSWVQTRPKPSDFFVRKNPQHDFLRKGSEAVCPMLQICGMLKNPVITWKLGHRQNQSAISRPIFPPFATRSACVDVDVGASGGVGENV
jgi:hypothetical protein